MTNEAAALEYYRAGLEERATLYVPARPAPMRVAPAAQPQAADLAGDGASTKDEIRMTDNKQYPPLPDFEEVAQHDCGLPQMRDAI